MVLKRKLPSKLTQEKLTITAEPMVEEIIASIPSVEEKRSVFVPKLKEEKSKSPIVESEKVEKNIVAEEFLEAIKPSLPQKTPMKRKVKKRSGATSALKQPKVPEDSALDPHVDISAPTSAHPEAEEMISSSMENIKGLSADPANEETEAAYISPTEQSKLKTTPVEDIAQMIEKAEEKPKKEEFPEPEPIVIENKDLASEERKIKPSALKKESFKGEDIKSQLASKSVKKSVEELKQEVKKALAPMPEPTIPSIPDDYAPPPSLAEMGSDSQQEDAWSFDAFPSTNTLQDEVETQSEPEQMPDIYQGATMSSGEASSQSKIAPPELPSSPKAAIGGNMRNKGSFSKLLVVGLVLVLFLGGVMLIQNGDKNRKDRKKIGEDFVADVQQDIPVSQLSNSVSMEQMEAEMAEELASVDSSEILEPSVLKKYTGKSATQIDFVNVSVNEAQEPIVADGAEDMPEDISALAKFQKEIHRVRKEKGKEEGVVEEVSTKGDSKGEIPSKREMENDLKAYRRALMEARSPEEILKPSEFKKGYYSSGTNEMVERESSAEGLPPSSAYLENPYNLPVIPEPELENVSQVRTLNDFDLALFEPETPKVRIPKGVRPRLGATDFPELEVLSFVSDRGIIATNRGKQGVLLLGEVLEGWELVGVYDDYAEFQNGTRKQIVSRE